MLGLFTNPVGHQRRTQACSLFHALPIIVGKAWSRGLKDKRNDAFDTAARTAASRSNFSISAFMHPSIPGADGSRGTFGSWKRPEGDGPGRCGAEVVFFLTLRHGLNITTWPAG